MQGLVIRSTGSFYEVLAEDDKKYSCRLRGKLRLDESKESNPVAVGDRVFFDLEQNTGSIYEIAERTNHMLRQSVKKTGHSHVLAANVDQVILLATLKQPRTSLGFIDRFLVSAESFRIPQVLIFNKSDLLTDKLREEIEKLRALYESIGVKTLVLSAREDSDFSGVLALLKDKVSLVAGHSGTGKSTLLNRLSPAIHQTVNAISGFSEKGTHTTTYAEMFKLNPGSFIIDTPGVKEWGLVNMGQPELSDYFPEMRDVRRGCKFGARCIHVSEPGCKIIEAVDTGQIARSRYESYLSMVLGEDNRK
jgi:ribosome biogenesis GTPase / thiamine phosphate phosphatase